MPNFHFKILFALCALSISHATNAEQKKPYLNVLELADNCREALKHPDKEFLQSYCAGIIQTTALAQQLAIHKIPITPQYDKGHETYQSILKNFKNDMKCFAFDIKEWPNFERDIAQNYVHYVDFLNRKLKKKDRRHLEEFGTMFISMRMFSWNTDRCNFFTKEQQREFNSQK